jgi:hypothetical protein
MLCDTRRTAEEQHEEAARREEELRAEVRALQVLLAEKEELEAAFRALAAEAEAMAMDAMASAQSADERAASAEERLEFESRELGARMLLCSRSSDEAEVRAAAAVAKLEAREAWHRARAIEAETGTAAAVSLAHRMERACALAEQDGLSLACRLLVERAVQAVRARQAEEALADVALALDAMEEEDSHLAALVPATA